MVALKYYFPTFFVAILVGVTISMCAGGLKEKLMCSEKKCVTGTRGTPRGSHGPVFSPVRACMQCVLVPFLGMRETEQNQADLETAVQTNTDRACDCIDAFRNFFHWQCSQRSDSHYAGTCSIADASFGTVY